MHLKVLPKGAKKLLGPLKTVAQKHGFILAGGTALALQIAHRESVDFDFFSTRDFAVPALLTELQTYGKTAVLAQDEFTLTCLLGQVKLSFFRYWDGFLFDFVKTPYFPLAAMEDIALMKLVAIANRGSRKDFIDLYFILQGGLALPNLFKDLKKKYRDQDFNAYHILKSLNYFADAEKEPLPRMLVPFQWKQAKDFFKREFAKEFDVRS